MGYRYFTTVTFPAAAEQIGAVAAAIDFERKQRADVTREPDVITIEVEEASYGELDITNVLDEYRVPYDHYHSDDCASSPDPYTVYVRFNENGERTQTQASDDEISSAALAEQLLDLLNAGNVDRLRSMLEELKAKGPVDTIEEIAPDWGSEGAAA